MYLQIERPKGKEWALFSSFFYRSALFAMIETLGKYGWRWSAVQDKLESTHAEILSSASGVMERNPKTEFIEAYDKYSDALLRHCYFRLSDREKAVEIVQETFLRAWDYVAEGKEVTHFRPFLYRIASNLVVEEYRKRKTVSLDAFLEGEGHDEGMIAGLRDDESTERLTDFLDGKRALEAVEKLPPSYREVIVLRYVDGLSPKEIAAYLKERENTVSVRIHRALAQLRDLLNT